MPTVLIDADLMAAFHQFVGLDRTVRQIYFTAKPLHCSQQFVVTLGIEFYMPEIAR